MRELKFRGYNSETKVMGELKTLWLDIKYKDHIHIMQYTGLKDKNGVYVYDGDILREVPKNGWEEINYSCFEVFFHDGDCNSDYNIGFTMNRMHNHGNVCGGYIPSFKPKTLKRMIVIGNIFENPELLNK